MKTENQIEAILFYKNEPVAIKELVKILAKSSEEIKRAIEELKKNLENRGLTLISLEDVHRGETISLATSKENSELIEKIAKDELSKEIGKAGLETLSIILYKGSVSRREIDYIRGVNSNFILRALITRGLVEKVENKADGRTFLYNPTLELLAFLGVESTKELPEFETINKEIDAI